MNISDEFSSKSIILGCLATVAADTEAPPSKGRRAHLFFPAVAAAAPPAPPVAPPVPADDALVPLLDPCWRDSSSERRSLPGQAQIRTSTDWRPRTLELCSRVKISWMGRRLIPPTHDPKHMNWKRFVTHSVPAGDQDMRSNEVIWGHVRSFGVELGHFGSDYVSWGK